jgi:chromosome segregation ATPase
VADTISLNVRRTPMSDGVTHFADDATLKRLRELEAEIQALELNRVMDRQQIDILKDDAASQQDRFLRCVKTRKDLADKCDKLEAENAELQKTPNELRRVLAEVRTENAKLQDALLRIKYSFAKGPGQRFGLADARAIAHAALEDTHE